MCDDPEYEARFLWLRHTYSYLRVKVALLRLQLAFETAFNPNRPRVPAGRSDPPRYRSERRVFRDYLDSLLYGNYSDFQLKELFRSADTDTSFLDVRDPRYFLAAVRDIIDGKSVQL